MRRKNLAKRRRQQQSKRVRKAVRRREIANAALLVKADLIDYLIEIKTKSQPQFIFPADFDSR